MKSKININPCTNYSVALQPIFLLNSKEYVGIFNTVAIGTKSGINFLIELIRILILTHFLFLGKYGLIELETMNVTAQGINSIEMQWKEPVCKATATIDYYSVQVADGWIGTDAGATTFKISPECLNYSDSTDFVTLVLTNAVCNNTAFQLKSCAPYDIHVLPHYVLASANEGLINTTISTQTLPDKDEATATNLQVFETGSKWFLLSWARPVCHLPILNWVFHELLEDFNFTLPADCPIMVGGQFRLNVTNNITCSDGKPLANFNIEACSDYKFRIDVEFPNMEIQNGSSNTINASSLVEGI